MHRSCPAQTRALRSKGTRYAQNQARNRSSIISLSPIRVLVCSYVSIYFHISALATVPRHIYLLRTPYVQRLYEYERTQRERGAYSSIASDRENRAVRGRPDHSHGPGFKDHLGIDEQTSAFQCTLEGVYRWPMASAYQTSSLASVRYSLYMSA